MKRRRRRYGRAAEGTPMGATEPLGLLVAEMRRGGLRAFVSKEPDGLFYSWRVRENDPDPYWSNPHWYFAFRKKKDAVKHMRVLVRP